MFKYIVCDTLPKEIGEIIAESGNSLQPHVRIQVWGSGQLDLGRSSMLIWTTEFTKGCDGSQSLEARKKTKGRPTHTIGRKPSSKTIFLRQ